MRIANVAILVDSGKVRFADDSSSQATIRFADRAAPAMPEAASIEGRFVGNSKDGPLAAIGLWTVESGGRLGSGERMSGRSARNSLREAAHRRVAPGSSPQLVGRQVDEGTGDRALA